MGVNVKGYTYLSKPVNFFGAVYAANRSLPFFSPSSSGSSSIFSHAYSHGKAIRAAAQDVTTAQLMGVNIHFVLGLCLVWAL